jgi:hypothetical protein
VSPQTTSCNRRGKVACEDTSDCGGNLPDKHKSFWSNTYAQGLSLNKKHKVLKIKVQGG